MEQNNFVKKCIICKEGRGNNCLYWHKDEDTNEIWVWCQGKCQRGYSLIEYCNKAGLSLIEFLNNDFEFQESKPNEVQAMAWPAAFIPLSDPRAQVGVDYISSRGLSLDGDMYYDMDRNGIVFPYYFGNHFCGAQIRLIEPRILEDDKIQKMDTMVGTRLGLLFYGWNQEKFMGNVKGIIVTEGSFNALAIMQSLNRVYGGITSNPWRVVACSGSSATEHQREAIKELKDQGIKIVLAPDTDEAGFKMLKKFNESNAFTHTALTADTDKDWNDLLKDKGHKQFASWFLAQIKKQQDVC